MKHFIRTFSLLALLSTYSLQVFAEQGSIRLSNTALKQVITVDEAGETTVDFVEPATVIPGDVILYTIEFENIGDQAASNIVIDDPVPNNSIYRDGSARGENTRIQYSIDGERFDSAENLLVEKDGRKVLASAEDYTAIRWIYTRDLLPGEKKSVSFKTRIRQPGE